MIKVNERRVVLVNEKIDAVEILSGFKGFNVQARKQAIESVRLQRERPTRLFVYGL